MPREILIGSLSQIPAGEGRTFVLDGEHIAVFHTRDGAVFATQAHCPHRGGPLADGLTDETTVVCPLHDRIYDLGTGAGIGTDCNIQTYPVRVDEEGTMLIVLHAQSAMAVAT
jgi:nitrite reductase (NADH) small subunit